MDWTYDLVTNTLAPADTQPSQIPLKWRSRELMRLQFLRAGTAELLPAGAAIALRLIGSTGTVFAAATSWTAPGSATGWYESDLILHTAALTTAFEDDTTKQVPASIELHWWRGGQAATPFISDNLLTAALQRPRALPESGSPIVLEGAWDWLKQRLPESAGYSHDEDAETIAPRPSWSQVSNKPSSFPPATHAHPISEVNGLQTALDAKVASDDPRLSNARTPTGGAGGVLSGTFPNPGFAVDMATQAELDAVSGQLPTKADLVDGKIPTSQLPALAISKFLGAVSSQSAMLALIGQEGDWCNRTDTSTAWVIIGEDPTQLASWGQINYPAPLVTSVNGQTGVIVLGKSDVGLGNVNNTSDANKPISNATQTALNAKVPETRMIYTSGLLVGGGNLNADRSFQVPVASQAEAEQGTLNDVAMTPLRVAQAIAEHVPIYLPPPLFRGTGYLQGYTVAGEPAEPPPPLFFTVSGLSPSFDISLTGYVNETIVVSDTDPGGVYFIDNASLMSSGQVALAIGSLLNSFPGLSAAVDGDSITVTTTVAGASVTLSATENEPALNITISGGGSGTDATPPSGETSEVIILPGVANKSIFPIACGMFSADWSASVQFALKKDGVYYPLGADLSASGEVMRGSYWSTWLNSVFGADLIARITGSIPTGGDVTCWAVAEQV